MTAIVTTNGPEAKGTPADRRTFLQSYTVRPDGPKACPHEATRRRPPGIGTLLRTRTRGTGPTLEMSETRAPGPLTRAGYEALPHSVGPPSWSCAGVATSDARYDQFTRLALDGVRAETRTPSSAKRVNWS